MATKKVVKKVAKKSVKKVAKKATKKAATKTAATKKSVKKVVKKVAKKATGTAIAFECFSPASGIVELAGDFNNWTPSETPMKKGDDGVWKAELKLKPGRYQYKFVFDGTSWELDPKAPAVGSEHGLNSYIDV